MIRAKLVLRNVLKKKLRSLIIILSLAAAAFASLFCISGINSTQNTLSDYFKANFGESDIIVSSNKMRFELKDDELSSGSEMIGISLTSVKATLRNGEYYNYVNTIPVSVLGIDTEKAAKMKLFTEKFPTENGITMTQYAASRLGLKEGDRFFFYGAEGKSYNLKILKVVPAERYLANQSISIITTPELSNKIAGLDDGGFSMILIDSPDEQIEKNIADLHQKHPEYYVFSTAQEDTDSYMDSMLSIYYLIFAVVLLMVCFIAVSMSKHIANERMAVVGMLRSIGGSVFSTGKLLLSESAFYGLSGGIIGTLLFLPLRKSTILNLFGSPLGAEIEVSDGITPLTIILVILGVTAIQCVFSAAAIIKASKTPVRDIIFGTKETAYFPSKKRTIIGFIMLLIGIVLSVLFDDFTFVILSAFLSAIGAVILFPSIIKPVAGLLYKLFTKLNMPVAKLAVRESATKKSNVSSSQLILSALSLSIAVMIIAISTMNVYSPRNYDCDIILNTSSEDSQIYDYITDIDGVNGIEKLYYKVLMYERIPQLNGIPTSLTVVSLNDGGFKYFKGVSDCPDKLEKNEVSVDTTLASKMGINIGDEITIKLNTDKIISSELKLKVKSICNGIYFNTTGNTILLNSDTYKSVYYDLPDQILIKTDPGKEYKVKDTLEKTFSSAAFMVLTIDEYRADLESSASGLLSILYAIIVLGFALSLLGTSSNMLMSFEQSRRKYAVYYSSSMSKEKLKKLILCETAFTTGISVISSVLFGLFFTNTINKALNVLDMSVPLVEPVGTAILFGAAAFIILMLTSLKPLRELSKMNIAEEIKTSAD